MQVLIVNHEAHTCRGLQALLAVWPQIEVVGTANGVEVVQMVEKCQPDVALMDIPMPVPARSSRSERSERSIESMDGLEVVRLIKSRWPQVRIVVLTCTPLIGRPRWPPGPTPYYSRAVRRKICWRRSLVMRR